MDIEILLALQQFRTGSGAILADFFSKMTFLAELNTVLVIMAILYWSVNKELGVYLMMGWSGNRLVNGVLKVTACAYRPWIRDERIVPDPKIMETATGYSFPSGHTMNAASVYGGGVMREEFSRILRGTLLMIVLLVAFSRMFVSVHTPQDVLVGTIAGLLVMWLVFKLMKWIYAHPEKDMYVVYIGIGLAIAVALYAGLKPYPADYDETGRLIVDGAKMANDTFKGVGWCIAFLLGWILERRFIGFSTDIPFEQRMARSVTGLLCYYAVSLIIVPQIKIWVPGPAGTVSASFLQMFYVSFLFPWCMVHMEKSLDPDGSIKQEAG